MGDYDRKPMEPPSVWLRLKSKGDEARIRIASSPYRELKVWPAEQGGQPIKSEVSANFTTGQWMTVMRDPSWQVSEVFHFLVIDRADAGAKVFTTTGGVYGKVRDYANNSEWGSPTGYDLTIKRTENPGKNYYEVTPSPVKSDLSADDLGKIDALDVHKLLPGAVPAASPQPDDFDDTVTAEPLPWDQPIGSPAVTHTVEPAAPINPPKDWVDEKPKDQKDDEIIDGDTPISLDDIPFDDDPSTSEKGSGKKS